MPAHGRREMAKHSKGTQLYIIDPADDSILEIECAINIEGLDSTVEQVETTCLADLARTFMAGLSSPGQASFTILADPSNASHVRLHQLKVAGTTLAFALGWGDGTDAPEFETDGEFDLPDTRTFNTFEGHVANFPFSFGLNAPVSSQIQVQISGEPGWFPKAA